MPCWAAFPLRSGNERKMSGMLDRASPVPPSFRAQAEDDHAESKGFEWRWWSQRVRREPIARKGLRRANRVGFPARLRPDRRRSQE